MDPAKKGQNVEEDDEFEEFAQEDWGPDQVDTRCEAPAAELWHLAGLLLVSLNHSHA